MSVRKEQVLQVLEYLRRVGWTKVDYQDYLGRCCLVGAINRAPSDGRHTRLNNEMVDFLEGILLRKPTEIVASLTLWNDRPERTFEDIEAFLTGAAELADAR